MALTGNKGEWSEVYTLFRLLGEGKVYAGDANLEKMDLYYPIINVIREESKRYEYKPDVEHHVVVIDENSNEYAKISMDKFMEESQLLLNKIKLGDERAFSIPETESFMTEIGCSKLKAPSTDKADIHIVIHDLRTNMKPLLGFSIKSKLGSDSTLLNATKATNFTYKVVGKSMADNELIEINSISNHLPRMKALLDRGYQLEYTDIENATFKNNLLFLDTCMPEFLSLCLLCDSMPNSTSTVKDAVKHVAQQNPFNFTGKNFLAFYEHKMKVLLVDVALGMTAAKEWTGRYDANGGYLVVKKDGDIVCYHFYNRNDVEDYLFNNTRFERASRSRHQYGELFRKSDGEVYIKLNLQIRFTK